jgi:predicted transcriptional regulator
MSFPGCVTLDTLTGLSAKIERGLAEVDNGQDISHREAKRRLLR